jgi:uncharacterized protein YgiM (DUF1202 family)
MINAETTPTPTATRTAMQTSEPESGAVFEIPTPKRTCAIVTAVQSLNLRKEPSEKSSAIYWLPTKTNVLVIGKVGAWWKVQADGYSGYAKADYLQESECR